MDDQELHFENTPLENLKSILSEADASMQSAPSTPSPKSAGVSKNEIRKAIERLSAEPQQFVSASLVRQMLEALVPGRGDPQQSGKKLFENQHVADLDRIIKSKIEIIY
jgi:hypothetical protein